MLVLFSRRLHTAGYSFADLPWNPLSLSRNTNCKASTLPHVLDACHASKDDSFKRSPTTDAAEVSRLLDLSLMWSKYR